MRIGIVNDHPAESELLRRVVGLRPEHCVIWMARTTDDAVALCLADAPDLVLLDVVGGSIDAVSATRAIRARVSCALLIVMGNVVEQAATVFEAMGQGALDAVDAPLSNGPLQDSAAPLLAKIATIAQLIDVPLSPSKLHLRVEGRVPRARALVAIGASAGGPAALASVLRQLPPEFPASIVVVQHIDSWFVPGMVDWLGRNTTLPVRIAANGARPVEGVVLLAGTNEHLVLNSRDELVYTPEPRHHVHHPSIDVFFESVSVTWKGPAVGVLLTGMGRDGAAGLKALRTRGFHTIAQDEASSIVYGMPKAAALLNAAVDILPIEHIAPRLVQLVTCREPALSPGKP